MKPILNIFATLAFLNIALFAATKVLGWLEPHFIRRFFKSKLGDQLLNDPELKDKRKIRSKYTHLFWSTWMILYFSIEPLTGFNLYLAFLSGLVLYFVGSAESNALAENTAKYREQEFLEAQDFTEKFLTEIQNRILVAQQDKKDDERN